MTTIFENIKREFQSLWKMRMRGNTMEITMPVATATDFFVSVFVSRDDKGNHISLCHYR